MEEVDVDSYSKLTCVAFDCDGVLVDLGSSWRVIHEHFGSDNQHMLAEYLARNISDEEFMRSDIQLWKEIESEIHRDDLIRLYQGVKLLPGARELVNELQSKGIATVIVSAGVDLLIGAVANMLKVDDWIANGFEYDEQGFLKDDGILRVSAWNKAEVITRFLAMKNLSPEGLISIGDSEMDLSMRVDGSRFIGFNPSRDSSYKAFEEAGVPIIYEKDLAKIRPILGLD